MRFRITGFIFIVMASALMAQQESVSIPDTPVGTQLERFLASIEPGQYENFIKERLGDGFFKDYTLEDHLQFFGQLSQMHGGFTVSVIEKSTPTSMVVLVKRKK